MRLLALLLSLTMLGLLSAGCSGPAPTAFPTKPPSDSMDGNAVSPQGPSLADGPAPVRLPEPSAPELRADSGESVPQLAETLPEGSETAKPKKRGFFDFVRNKVETSVKNRVRPDETEIRAMDHMDGMLAQDKLGGMDGIFNQRDIDAVTDSLMRDPAVIAQIESGIKDEAKRRASTGWFQPVKRSVADWATSPGNPISYFTWDGIWKEGVTTARSQIRQRMEDGFESEGITAQPGLGPDRAIRRGITQKGMDRFQASADTLKAYGDRVTAKIGALAPQYDFPHGIGQADVRAIKIMETPPNGVKR